MIATSFWEAYSEGRKAWDKGKLGWKIKTGKYCFTAYHFYLFVITIPFLMTLPLVAFGWNTKLFGILLSAYFSGIIIEDFMWYVVNPKVKLSELNPKFANYYPWLKIGKFQIPAYYVLSFLITIGSWALIWR